jgi:hypothetical protein
VNVLSCGKGVIWYKDSPANIILSMLYHPSIFLQREGPGVSLEKFELIIIKPEILKFFP